MRDVSAAFLAALRGSHTMRCEAYVCTTYQNGVSPDGVEIPIIDGDVIHDGKADVRSTLDLATLGDFPYKVGDLLVPYGNEIFVRRGVEFGDRSTEWVSQGYFRIETVSQRDVPTGAITVTASDRMAGIIDGRLTSPRQYVHDTTVKAVFEDLIFEVYPGAVVEFPDMTADAVTINRRLVCEEDRYEFLRDLAASHGRNFYVDHRGHFVVRRPPAATEALWTVNGGEGGVLVEASREISRRGVYNGVVATGEGADDVDPVRSLAVDNDERSPTYWLGPFGKVPRFYSSPMITTLTQARTAARKLLQDNLGLPYSLDFTAIPNPALEPDDPVEVRLPDQTYVHTIEKVTVPLVASAPLTAQTKDVTLVQRIEEASA